jgi:putative hemolysin
MDIITAVIAMLGLLIFIGFFSGIEIAFISVNKLAIELNKKQGTRSGKVWGNLAEHPTRFIGTVLICYNIALVSYSLIIGTKLAYFGHQIHKRFPNVSENGLVYLELLIGTLVAVFFLLVIESFSKALFRAKNNSILSNGLITYLVQAFYWLFASIATFFVSVAEWILKIILNVSIKDKKELFSKGDLEHYYQQNKGHHEDETSELNKELFENALSLSETKLRECLVPRKEVISIDINTPMEEVKQKFIETRLSKLVVCENNIDSISGYIHQLDLFKNPAKISEILLPIPTVPESMSATDLMNKFSKDRKSIAWVIDEFGGTAGIVTMEDLLEEIFGEIKDEYDDVDEFVEKQLAENEYIFSGRLELDYIAEKYDLHFTEVEGAETLSGYIIQNNEDIPQQKQRIIVGKYEFDILSVSGTRIETVKLKVLK